MDRRSEYTQTDNTELTEMYWHRYISIPIIANLSEFAVVTQKFELCYWMFQELHIHVNGCVHASRINFFTFTDISRKVIGNQAAKWMYSQVSGKKNVCVLH